MFAAGGSLSGRAHGPILGFGGRLRPSGGPGPYGAPLAGEWRHGQAGVESRGWEKADGLAHCPIPVPSFPPRCWGHPLSRRDLIQAPAASGPAAPAHTPPPRSPPAFAAHPARESKSGAASRAGRLVRRGEGEAVRPPPPRSGPAGGGHPGAAAPATRRAATLPVPYPQVQI